MTATKPRGYVPGQLTVHAGPAGLRAVTRTLKAAGRRIVLVPTMGEKFGAGEDLERYPRPLEADLAICREEGAELAFTPGVDDMYPAGADTTVTPGALGSVMEGAVRPGHFAGVLTVVSKLFHVVAPDVAYFGEKDYQQLVLVRKMARDLDFALDVVGVPTVREDDGVAGRRPSWRPRGPSSRGNRPCSSTTSSCATPTCAPTCSRARRACW